MIGKKESAEPHLVAPVTTVGPLRRSCGQVRCSLRNMHDGSDSGRSIRDLIVFHRQMWNAAIEKFLAEFFEAYSLVEHYLVGLCRKIEAVFADITMLLHRETYHSCSDAMPTP